MLTTIGEVKAAARKLWPVAADFQVTLVNPSHPTDEGYRIIALAKHDRVLGHRTAPSLNALKALLERQLIDS
jgi:hypothetical protein